MEFESLRTWALDHMALSERMMAEAQADDDASCAVVYHDGRLAAFRQLVNHLDRQNGDEVVV